MNAADIIREIIRKEESGCISFARFMDLALYQDQVGYYEHCQIGRAGDFFTSVSAGGLFGELLATQFLEWIRSHPVEKTPEKWVILETGAHDGRLALDILWFLNRKGAFKTKTPEYWILETSRSRKALQQKTLSSFKERVCWFDSWDSLPSEGISGVLFSNELLDAFPVHRLAWDAQLQTWYEWGVGMEADRFQWIRCPQSETRAMGMALDYLRYSGLIPWDSTQEETQQNLSLFFPLIPDSYILEVCPSAWTWWEKASKAIQSGFLLTFDYGFHAEDLLSPMRTQGTLRAYRQHQTAQSILDVPGEQDITASINFSILRQVSEQAGLKCAFEGTQNHFLSQIVARALKSGGEQTEWNDQRLRQFHTLIHPDHLGDALKAIVFQTPDRKLD